MTEKTKSNRLGITSWMDHAWLGEKRTYAHIDTEPCLSVDEPGSTIRVRRIREPLYRHQENTRTREYMVNLQIARVGIQRQFSRILCPWCLYHELF